jgi:hypothetical protein
MSRVWDYTTPENSNLHFTYGETVVPKGWSLEKAKKSIIKTPHKMTLKDHQEYRYWVKWRTQCITER